MKKYYHTTSLESVRSISNAGLMPNCGENCKLDNDSKEKVCFSEGMTGTIAMYAEFQKKYDLVKSDVVLDVDKETISKVKASKDIQDFFGEGVYVIFDGTDIENEKNFMDGSTEKTIEPEKLNVCILRNNDTNEITYSRFDIIHYMMSKVPTETVQYSGKDISAENIDKQNEIIRKNIDTYIEAHKEEINKFKAGNYTLESIPIKDFCMQYLYEKGSTITGQSLGKATMDLLKDVEKVQMMEAQLDRDVRALERDDVEQEDHKLIPEERTEHKIDDMSTNQ